MKVLLLLLLVAQTQAAYNLFGDFIAGEEGLGKREAFEEDQPEAIDQPDQAKREAFEEDLAEALDRPDQAKREAFEEDLPDALDIPDQAKREALDEEEEPDFERREALDEEEDDPDFERREALEEEDEYPDHERREAEEELGVMKRNWFTDKFKCKKLNKKCRGFPKCCKNLQCYWPNGYSLRKSGRCIVCAGVGLSCQRDSQCCSKNCEKEKGYHVNGKCAYQKTSGGD